jgi:DNA-binding winged helix-turn-helix (wHTH) protein/tetratricopeptide (TPR) repeat protein
MGPSDDHIFEFGEFRLIPAEGLLLHVDEPVALPIKAFATLVLLVERHGHLVHKSELLEEIWGGAFVEEAVVSRCVWSVRHALGDTSKEKFIQTIPKRGYRFVHPVSVVTGSRSEESADPYRTLHAKPAARRRSFRWLAVYAVVGIVLLMGVSLYAYLKGPNTRVNASSEPGTTNEEAYTLYRQAENLSTRRNQENMPTALDYLNRAVTLDSNFARAWAAKAHLHRYLAEYPGGDQGEQYERSMEALERALAIDPNLSEAHSALCLNKLRYEYDSAGAERACIRAVELDPNSFLGHKAYATFLYSRGRFNESIAEANLALKLQPLALENQQAYALALHYARRYEDEETQWRRLIELNPTHGYIYTRLFMNLKQQGKDDKAFDYLIKKLALGHANNELTERFRGAYATSGWRGVTVERIKHPENEPFTGPFDVACLYATVGDNDKAFENLEKAFLEHSYRIAVLQVEPQLDSLRSDPRYADLVQRVEWNANKGSSK